MPHAEQIMLTLKKVRKIVREQNTGKTIRENSPKKCTGGKYGKSTEKKVRTKITRKTVLGKKYGEKTRDFR